MCNHSCIRQELACYSLRRRSLEYTLVVLEMTNRKASCLYIDLTSILVFTSESKENAKICIDGSRVRA